MSITLYFCLIGYAIETSLTLHTEENSYTMLVSDDPHNYTFWRQQCQGDFINLTL